MTRNSMPNVLPCSTTLVERFMKREEKNKMVCFPACLFRARCQNTKEHTSCRLEICLTAVRYGLASPSFNYVDAFHKRWKPRALPSMSPEMAMLMVVLQINSNYFDGRFPRPDNCPFECQLTENVE